MPKALFKGRKTVGCTQQQKCPEHRYIGVACGGAFGGIR
eukprot:CAMPEP_0174368434 /NCGR_PEP_ID=MMETSP0811_2-20130205/89028_1 /TAXON_ID=73025 ORGANISM="Eutreptiella gymnastica-like, Strain CCMP1594" /NCGR_SAMPLE_ID=MMETSP0811_2 /ASSEMBLY_ACC=CAM_ASM_000667 /LENGTH=38 /DNA_ID= /DNA_START= /DNA_END= /DNA_ORIENTATION=